MAGKSVDAPCAWTLQKIDPVRLVRGVISNHQPDALLATAHVMRMTSGARSSSGKT
jgi:hypothetical protein